VGVRSEWRDGSLGGSAHGQCEIFQVRWSGTSMDACIGKISGSDKVS